jgi:hypothetical protein
MQVFIKYCHRFFPTGSDEEPEFGIRTTRKPTSQDFGPESPARLSTSHSFMVLLRKEPPRKALPPVLLSE